MIDGFHDPLCIDLDAVLRRKLSPDICIELVEGTAHKHHMGFPVREDTRMWSDWWVVAQSHRFCFKCRISESNIALSRSGLNVLPLRRDIQRFDPQFRPAILQAVSFPGSDAGANTAVKWSGLSNES